MCIYGLFFLWCCLDEVRVDAGADGVIARVLQQGAQHRIRRKRIGATGRQHLEQARAPAGNLDNTLLVLRRLEVLVLGTKVPDDDARRLPAATLAEELLAGKTEGTTRNLRVRLVLLGLDRLNVASASVIAVAASARRRIKAHVREDDEVLGLLTRRNGMRLEVGQHQVVGSLEVCVRALCKVAHLIDAVHQVHGLELVERRRAVEGQDVVREHTRIDLGDKAAQRHRDIHGRAAHRAAKVAHRESAVQRTRAADRLPDGVPGRLDSVALINRATITAKNATYELVRKYCVGAVDLRHTLRRLFEVRTEVLLAGNTVRLGARSLAPVLALDRLVQERSTVLG